MVCFIDIYSNYAQAVLLKEERGVTITETIQKSLYESGKKPNKLWVDQESEFHNRLIRYGCKDNDIEIYLAHNGRKSVVAKRLNSTLDIKIYKPVTEVSKNKYTDMLDEKVDKYNSRYHKTIKITPIDVLSQVHTLEINDKDPKF